MRRPRYPKQVVTRGKHSTFGRCAMWRLPGLRAAVLAALLVLLTGCHSAGLYGHARTYVPLSDEADAAAHAKNYDPVMAQRMPDKWRGKTVSVFGVVKRRTPGPGGTTDLTLSVRTLARRNLCANRSEESCRVTVSDHEYAVVHTLVKLRADDDIGKNSVGVGSLVRVIGVIGDNVDQSDGTPVVRANYYRHWPRNYYVTTADRATMRQ